VWSNAKSPSFSLARHGATCSALSPYDLNVSGALGTIASIDD
jgi:hypothetical protein